MNYTTYHFEMPVSLAGLVLTTLDMLIGEMWYYYDGYNKYGTLEYRMYMGRN